MFVLFSTKNLCVGYPPVKVISLASKAVPSVILNNPENVHFLCVCVCLWYRFPSKTRGWRWRCSLFPGKRDQHRENVFPFFCRRRNRIFQSIGFALDKHEKERKSFYSAKPLSFDGENRKTQTEAKVGCLGGTRMCAGLQTKVWFCFEVHFTAQFSVKWKFFKFKKCGWLWRSWSVCVLATLKQCNGGFLC